MCCGTLKKRKKNVYAVAVLVWIQTREKIRSSNPQFNNCLIILVLGQKTWL
jgi:hypothetical protein